MINLQYKNYNTSLLSVVKRHWSSTIPYLNITKMFNIVLALLERRLGKVTIRSKPYFVKIEPTNKCNLRCKGCLHAADRAELNDNKELGQMDFSLFEKIINELEKYLVKVSLYSLGEPLIYPQIAEMIEYLTKRKIGSVISSNLNYLPEPLAANLVKNKLTHLIVSLDGPNSKIYNDYRVGGNFETVIKNIRLINSEKKIQNSKYPKLEIQMIRFKHTTENEIIEMKKFVESLKVDLFTLKDDVTPKYKVPTPIKKNCFWLYGNPSFKWDGTLQPCCNFYEHTENNFGNVATSPVSDIYNNEDYRNARDYFNNTGVKPEKKTKCHSCVFFKS